MVIANALGGATDLISQARQAVADVVSGSADAARVVSGTTSDAASSLFSGDTFDRDNLRATGRSLWEGFKDVVRGESSFGQALGGALDTLGLPDWASQLAGAGLDFMMGNPRGKEQLLAGLSGIAGQAGFDGLSGFLDTASSVTGMAVGVGEKAALMYLTGGTGALGSLGQAGQLGNLGQLHGALGQAGNLLPQLQTAVGVVDALENRDLSAAGRGALSLFQGNTELLQGITKTPINPELLSGMQSLFGGDSPPPVQPDNLFGGLMNLLMPLADDASGPFLSAAQQLSQAFVDHAAQGPEEVQELLHLFTQLASLNQSTNVTGLLGAQVRA